MYASEMTPFSSAAPALPFENDDKSPVRVVGSDPTERNDPLRRVADGGRRQHGKGGGGRDRVEHDDLGARLLQRGDLAAEAGRQSGRGGLVGLTPDDVGARDLLVEALDAVLAELVVLGEVADLLAR